MLVFQELKPFFQQIMRYVGNGYTECQISTIPEKKRYKVPHIDAKLKKRYKSDLTQGQRQYRRKKGQCNYAVLRYRDFCYLVLKSKGKDETGEKWNSIYRTPIPVGSHLVLELLKDERGRNTVKVEKKAWQDIRSAVLLSIEKRAGARFHGEIGKVYNLSKVLPYRGINLQISSLLKAVKQAQKEHGTKWTVPVFFSKKNRVTSEV